MHYNIHTWQQPWPPSVGTGSSIKPNEKTQMKNNDQQSPYEPSLAEVAGFQTRIERTIFSDFNEFDNEKDLVQGPNELDTRLILLVIVVLVIAALLLMVTKTPPTALATIGWNA
jgi:hypothetical protein